MDIFLQEHPPNVDELFFAPRTERQSTPKYQQNIGSCKQSSKSANQKSPATNSNSINMQTPRKLQKQIKMSPIRRETPRQMPKRATPNKQNKESSETPLKNE